MQLIHRSGVGVMVALLVGALALVGCSSNDSGAGRTVDVAAAAAELTGSQPQATGGGEAGPTRTNSAGSVTINVTWKNPGDTADDLTFSVVMDTHSVELDGYDLGKLAVLRNDRGQEIKPKQWDAPSGGHHRSGVLLFPAKDSSGKLIAGQEARSIELVIRDVANVKERVLRWELEG